MSNDEQDALLNHFWNTIGKKSNNPTCGSCEFFNGEIGDGEQFCDELENYVSEKFYCNKYNCK